MEIPENIYVHVKGDKVTNTWNSTWVGVHDIEYVRKDAFIEKACKYLKENATFTHPRKGTEECIINIPKIIEYIKGE